MPSLPKCAGCGILIGAILLLHSTVWAFAQTPNEPGVPQSRPAPETQTDREADESAAESEQFEVPVRLLESPEETERRERKEQRAEEREQADLDAQRGMAQSARKMLGPAWWQVWIAAGGALLLSASLLFSARATSAAAAAATAAQDVLKAERAWLTYDTIDKEFFFKPIFDDVAYDEAVGYRIVWKNSGRTPALKVKLHFEPKIVYNADASPIFSRPACLPSEGTIVGVGQTRETGQVKLMGKDLNSFLAQRATVFIYSRVTYMDIFSPDTPRFSETCVQLVCYGRTPSGDPALGVKFVGGYDVCT